MVLIVCWDVAPADWITGSSLPWHRLVTFGPAGFGAYARLRLLPDPVRAGQRETDAATRSHADQLPRLLEALAAHTTTPGTCYFCVWEGFGQAEPLRDDTARYVDPDHPGTSVDPGARPGAAPATADPLPRVPRVVVPHRAYWLFRGPLVEAGAWDTAVGWPAHVRLDGVPPAFVWPADRAWCVALDVDPHWAGIGCTGSVRDRLVADRRLDVVPADPTREQPTYR